MVRLIDSDNPKTYDEYRLDESSFHKKKYSKVMAFVEKNKKFKVLEIGAGTGTYTKFLAKNFPKLIATDLRKEMIDKLNGKKIGVKNKTCLLGNVNPMKMAICAATELINKNVRIKIIQYISK